MSIKSIENDRKRIILLKHKIINSTAEDREYNKLMQTYPDNENYKYKLYQELSSAGFIEYTGLEAIQNEDGDFIQQEPFDHKKYRTTVRGELSLNSLFESELTAKTRNQRFKKVESLGILIGGLVGLLALLTFLYHQIQRFLK
jgi:hypothetical protein